MDGVLLLLSVLILGRPVEGSTTVLSFCRIVKLHTAFFNEEGVLITHPLECAKHYFRYKEHIIAEQLTPLCVNVCVCV